jgi:hypothetical protein
MDRVMQEYAGYIQDETLAESIIEGESPDGLYSEKTQNCRQRCYIRSKAARPLIIF